MHDFETEKYLNETSENTFRIALCKLRTSSKDLETGQHLNIPRQGRVCSNCNMRTVENEYHFLLVCLKDTELRNKYLKHYCFRWLSINKF